MHYIFQFITFLTCEGKLYRIPSSTTKSINYYVSSAYFCSFLGNWFRSDGVPTFCKKNKVYKIVRLTINNKCTFINIPSEKSQNSNLTRYSSLYPPWKFQVSIFSLHTGTHLESFITKSNPLISNHSWLKIRVQQTFRQSLRVITNYIQISDEDWFYFPTISKLYYWSFLAKITIFPWRITFSRSSNYRTSILYKLK